MQADGDVGQHDSGHVRSSDSRAGRMSAGGVGINGPGASLNGGIPDEAAMHPSSWPPASQRNLMRQVQGCLLCRHRAMLCREDSMQI